MRHLRLAVALALVGAVACGSGHRRLGRRVIVLGFDGLDHGVTRDLMTRGRLPNFSRLAALGSFAALGTSVPPQSPVAWSTFMTGLDPGRHGIFDFVHRDPKTMTPYLSTTKVEAPSRMLTLGKWQFPLSPGHVTLLRKGQPFWDALERRGIETTIVRMPANFPPSGKATRELSGMGTPDILGTYGTFSFFTSSPKAVTDRSLAGGAVYAVDASAGVVHGVLEGPENPFLTEREHAAVPFSVAISADRQFGKLMVGSEERMLRVGEWSDWVPIAFDLIPTQHVSAEVRFFLARLDPYVELYVSPANMDPMAPALPISTDTGYAAELARATGRFYTQGMPEDTKSLKTHVLTTAQFLQQAALAGDEVRRQYDYTLGRFHDGFLFYYFGNVDQVSHMLWRARDPQHPAYDPATDPQFAHVVEDLYVGLDAIVGRTLDTLGANDLLVVMSDHGFTSWRRSFHLNSWLRDNGYLRATIGPTEDAGVPFGNVDWSRTRAYAVGLNGLYINVQGREAYGTVPASAREALAKEIAGKLVATVDPATGAPAVSRVFRREEVYNLAGSEDIAPDLIVGYAKGTRSSDESALGGLSRDVIVDNRDPWSGDHCMDPAAVPGILFSSRPLRKPAPDLKSLASAILAELGIDDFPSAAK
jgi:predicted AlkP superfamily phosphohydrolase/phosphomutase